MLLLAITGGGLISNCSVTGSLEGRYSNVGGLVGCNDSGMIIGCYVDAVVQAEESSYVGGLVGENKKGTILGCHMTGTVKGRAEVGGFAGFNNEGTISSCYSTAKVTGTRGEVGGFSGRNNGGKIADCFATGEVEGAAAHIGGFAGIGHFEVSFINCYSTGKATSAKEDIVVGGFIGRVVNATLTGCYWDTERSGVEESAGGEGRTTDQMTYPYGLATYELWDFTSKWAADTEGDINGKYPYLRILETDATVRLIPISSLDDLRKIGNDAQLPLDGAYILTEDIDATATSGWNGGAGFIPIGSSTTPFTGTFDGLGHSITGLTINRPEEDQVGLFREIKSEGAAIKNLRLENCSIIGKRDVGALAGLNFFYPVISGCSVTGTVTGTGTSVGGLVGRNYDGWIRNCAASVTV
ncbi:MAG: GLUG motif-containing protein, partial [Candidatus Hydrogenedentales bacterium]